MSRITPQVHISTPQGEKYKYFKTYHKDLKPALKGLFHEYNVNELFVVRYKRGEWGEFCETWKLINNKPKIVKEGWS